MNSIPYFDAHADTLSMCAFTGRELAENCGHVDLKRAAQYGKFAQFFSIFADGKGSSDIREYYDKILAVILGEIKKNEDVAVLCKNAQDLENAGDKRCILISVEGAELIGCCEEGLKKAWEDGVRMLTLTWNHDNDLAGSCAGEGNRGLTQRGREVVKLADELGVIIDVSHSSEKTFWDVAEVSTKPFIASHSNSAAVWPHRRNLTNDQFSHIVKCGGVAGLNMYADFLGDKVDMACVVRHIENFMSLGGEKNVALGGDLDGCDRLPEGMNGLQDMPLIYEALLRLNYNEDVVRDIFYNNLKRVVQTVCGI
ncbi:MAG: membrane dipeptidase [Oscillospiraceae bacterium]|nr:membrane dipeptidase [Oscillospiraceae bacterium]